MSTTDNQRMPRMIMAVRLCPRPQSGHRREGELIVGKFYQDFFLALAVGTYCIFLGVSI